MLMEVFNLAVVNHNSAEVKLLARLMRAEAEGDLQQGMLHVGTVGVNRVRGDCLDFTKINTITQMVYQTPGGFEATHKSYFYQAARAMDIRLAKRALNGERTAPSTNALWFYNPFDKSCKVQWFGQWNSGRYKSHCFYAPVPGENCYGDF